MLDSLSAFIFSYQSILQMNDHFVVFRRICLGIVVAGATLGFTDSASGQSQTFGSALTASPNISIDCAQQPIIADTTGNYGLFQSGTADCTWRQTGVFGVVAGDSRFSSVPGDGVISQVRVRSGPNPAPLRFVVLRQLSTPGFGAVSQCCFFVSETQTVQPAPNSISVFNTNIPVQRNTINGFLAVDLMGISAAAGTGTLPLFSTGRNNAFQLTEFGSVNSGFFYPRIGALANDLGGGRREEGIPGVELLVQFVWNPLGATLLTTQGRLISGSLPLQIVCSATGACRGVVEVLRVPVGRRSFLSPVTLARAARLGRASYSGRAGRSVRVSVPLAASVARELRRKRSISLLVRIRPAKNGAASESIISVRR